MPAFRPTLGDMRLKENGLFDFARAMFAGWFTRMSGPLSVPAAALALWVENDTAKYLLGATAFVCLWATAYFVWKAERDKNSKLDGHKAQLMRFYIEAGELLKNFPNPHSMIGKYHKDVSDFTKRTSAWIETNMGPASQSRFLDLGSKGQEGDAIEWQLKLRRENLARLIESEHWG